MLPKTSMTFSKFRKTSHKKILELLSKTENGAITLIWEEDCNKCVIVKDYGGIIPFGQPLKIGELSGYANPFREPAIFVCSGREGFYVIPEDSYERQKTISFSDFSKMDHADILERLKLNDPIELIWREQEESKAIITKKRIEGAGFIPMGKKKEGYPRHDIPFVHMVEYGTATFKPFFVIPSVFLKGKTEIKVRKELPFDKKAIAEYLLSQLSDILEVKLEIVYCDPKTDNE